MKKKFIFLVLFSVTVGYAFGQTDSLSIEVKSGNLKDSIPKEWRQTITKLTLRGNMIAEDFFLSGTVCRNWKSWI